MATARQEIMHSLAADGWGTTVRRSTPGADQSTIPAGVVDFDFKGNLLPDPYGDDYLHHLGVLAAGESESVIVFPLLPGVLEYYRENGLVAQATQIIEVPHTGGRRNGFPYGDPLEQLGHLIGEEGAVLRNSDTGQRFTLVPTLTNPYVEEQAKRLGMEVLGQPDSTITNNKALLRQAEHKYGLHMLPGELITHETDLDYLDQKYGKLQHGVWIKFPTGSGGDLVLHVKQVNPQSIKEAITKLRNSVWQAFRAGEFGMSGQEFWPEDKIAPEQYPLVIESDARNLGDIVILGSNHFGTSPDGVDMYGYFRQITGEDGSFIGSERFYPDPTLKAQIDARTRRVGQFAIDLGYYGVAGEDYIVVRRPNGKLEVFDLELNARTIISTFPDIVGERTGIPTWKNVNITLPHAISSMDDFAQIIGEDLYTREADAGVVPMAFRSVVDQDEGIIPSPHCKVVILGNEERQQEIIARLQAKGVKIGQTV